MSFYVTARRRCTKRYYCQWHLPTTVLIVLIQIAMVCQGLVGHTIAMDNGRIIEVCLPAG